MNIKSNIITLSTADIYHAWSARMCLSLLYTIQELQAIAAWLGAAPCRKFKYSVRLQI